LGFSRELRPAIAVETAEIQQLLRAGINVITRGPAGSARMHGSVTMGRRGAAHREFASLPVTRLCLRVINAIETATRWAVFAADDTGLAQRIRAQVTACLTHLVELGAFENETFVVECDAGMRKRTGGAARDFTIYVAFQPLGASEPIAFSIHQAVAGSRVTSTAFAPG
jgi:phage tail sheath protein FI